MKPKITETTCGFTVSLHDTRQTIGTTAQLSSKQIAEMEERKNDLEFQHELCQQMMQAGELLPFPFERAVILLNKAKRHKEALAICTYIKDHCDAAKATWDGTSAMTWESPRLQRCIARIGTLEAKAC